MGQELMPAAFIGHGSPLNTLERNRYTDAWRVLGEKSRGRGDCNQKCRAQRGRGRRSHSVNQPLPQQLMRLTDA